MSPRGFEPTIPENEQLQTQALDGAATESCTVIDYVITDQVFIIIIIIIIIISFMQGIYSYIPETNYIPTEYSVAAILLLLFMVLISLVSMLNLLYFYISTFRSMCSVPIMAVFYSSLTSMLIKIQPDATVSRYLFTAKSLYMFRVSQHPSSGVLKTVTVTSGTGHNTGTATSFQSCLIIISVQLLPSNVA